MMSHPRRHRRGSVNPSPLFGQRLMHSTEVVVHHGQRERVSVILHLLTKGVGQSRVAPVLHPDGEVELRRVQRTPSLGTLGRRGVICEHGISEQTYFKWILHDTYPTEA